MDSSNGYKTLETSRGKKFEYYLHLPATFDAEKTYRTILAIPPGDQTEEYVDAYRNWFDYFAKEGWVMISPVTPDGKLFFQGSERYIPKLLDHIQSEIKLHGDKFYLLGVSNGGINAFRNATLQPERVHSITGIPGWPKPADENRLDKIISILVNFVVGENDDRWRKKSEEFYGTLKTMGCNVSLELIPNEEHMAFHSYQLDKLKKLLLRNH